MLTEVFKRGPGEDPGYVFYTVTAEDVGRSVIDTTAGLIHVSSVLGRVVQGDVGRRLYRVPMEDGSGWIWQTESLSHMRARRYGRGT